jgi:hypothetical protein
MNQNPGSFGPTTDALLPSCSATNATPEPIPPHVKATMQRGGGINRVDSKYEVHHDEHRQHRSLGQAAPLKPLPETVVDLDAFRARRRDRIGGVIHQYSQVA